MDLDRSDVGNGHTDNNETTEIIEFHSSLDSNDGAKLNEGQNDSKDLEHRQ